MSAIRALDPAMCCSTGVCGPAVDPRIVRFATDLNRLEKQGVSVERFNLAQQPAAFAADASVNAALEVKGEAALPLIQVNGEVTSTGAYPSRDELAAWVGLSAWVACGSSEGAGEVALPVTSRDCCAPSIPGDPSPRKSTCC